MSDINEKKVSCPIPIVHKRLNEVFVIWNEAIQFYQEPEEFCIKVNSAIQSLRNVTFILQSEKAKIKNFDKWYSVWQEKMRNDHIMKWLCEARNRIVKQGDLETKSIAKVSIVTYENVKVLELSFSPFSKIEEIANGIMKFGLVKIPPEIENDAILSFERKWIVNELPDMELLTIIAYGYSFLSRLLGEVHEKLGYKIDHCEFNRNKQNFSNNRILLEMTTTEKYRTHNIVYSSGDVKKVNSLNFNERIEDGKGGIKIEIIKKLQKKYGDAKDILKQIQTSPEPFPFSEADLHIKTTKRLLSKDKYLQQMVFLFTSEREPPCIIAQNPQDRSDKYLLMQEVSNKVKEIGATAIITVNEAWYVQLDKTNPKFIQPSKSPNRKEGISIVIATPNKAREYQIPFTKSIFGKIKFGKVKITDNYKAYFLQPVFDVWENTQK